jgi:exodeoxyribonuclease VII large subunit
LRIYRSAIHLRKQQVHHLSRRFRLETTIVYLGNEKSKLANKAATLRAADPSISLKRGFSLVYAEDGNLVKSISQIQPADVLKTEIGDGRIISTVDKTERK